MIVRGLFAPGLELRDEAALPPRLRGRAKGPAETELKGDSRSILGTLLLRSIDKRRTPPSFGEQPLGSGRLSRRSDSDGRNLGLPLLQSKISRLFQ
mmetsp:Transcript_21769/g.37377  ORF Transcript_21769/g.37377 Transcript_21769/m.37377 type:complete len:96 (+) Transcript_21769:271-558(+)